ncbi:SAM-dependent methyltransferase [Pseudochelatococcus contaminans]|uniref:Cyclopropane-fatty-acyl-phospholipid synthase n=1 Tax=Pseudochelatococcus contaminans TaxID=1538103 RepID=A0A7W5Z6P9_9HYPH|nr:cyclopropane-fatty-acyl-phospholipid synthase family protein [Pseudochelatococcus contaminans]MBB3810692.1 cyclopropane-fatty-acyl-phospholipid synthase [Pseudochelatococcus contaminans]
MPQTPAGRPLSEPVRLDRQNFSALAGRLPLQARMMLGTVLDLPHGSLTLHTPEGQVFLIGGNAPGPHGEIVLRNWRLAIRAFASATVGVAESYIDGDWDSPDVTALLELFAVNEATGQKVARGAGPLFDMLQRLRHWLNRNTRAGARRNISAHYDLGNAFYRQWLDPSMTYSSALYADGANDLESAQAAKYRALARDTGIGPSDHVLEIGCGWGGFAEFAAREIGCRVTALTISREQHAFASERIARAGLAEKVDIRLQDYRDERGQYDRIASIEMFEAVGERYWLVFFRQLHQCLKPGGTAGMQVITIRDSAYARYRAQPDFIQRYIFPGGMLPTPSIMQSLSATHGLTVARERIFPQDYARTLAEWRNRFQEAWETIAPLGFDERFRKLWTFYLHYCEAGFRANYIDVRQITFQR